MALGNQAKANIEHGVALGSSSETTVAKGVTGFNPTTQGNSDIRANAYAPLNGKALTSTLAGGLWGVQQILAKLIMWQLVLRMMVR